jgi:hypothetical protein
MNSIYRDGILLIQVFFRSILGGNQNEYRDGARPCLGVLNRWHVSRVFYEYIFPPTPMCPFKKTELYRYPSGGDELDMRFPSVDKFFQ